MSALRTSTPRVGTPLIDAGAQRSWFFSVSFVVTDLILAGNLFALVGAYWLNRSFPWPALLQMGGFLLAGHALAFTYSAHRQPRVSLLLGRIALGNILAGLIFLVGKKWFHGLV